MGTKISKQTRCELLETLRERYRNASKIDKTKILDEFIDLAGCHRKHAIRLLTGVDPVMPKGPRLGRTIYSEAVRQALVVLWEAADRICGKRLKAILPGLISAMERHGHLTLDSNVRQLLLAASPATIDRLLAPIRGTAGRRRKRKATTRSRREIPVRTFADWKEPAPGFLEIDFVAHGGDSMQGTFLWSLVATDVCSGWTEAVALVAREQSLVVEGLEVIRCQLPVPVLGIDSDNDSAFINETLQGYCKERQIEFTRSRPYQKNDQAWIEALPHSRCSGPRASRGPCDSPGFQGRSGSKADLRHRECGRAWIEQKNGSVIRRFVGDRRFSGLIAGQCLARLYRMIRLYVNYFQPSFKLLSKTRDGAKIKKRYHKPATPCERLLAHTSVSDGAKEALRAGLAPLDPADLLHQIREGQAALAALGSGDLSHGPERQGLKEFLAKLPELWREGEVRPTHRIAPSSPRTWRTRKDPFEEVWPEILLWLQHDPDSTAKSLMERLQRVYPDRFPDVLLRTLQRRVREWRHVMARSLVHGIRDGSGAEQEPNVVGASASDSTRENATKPVLPGASDPGSLRA